MSDAEATRLREALELIRIELSQLRADRERRGWLSTTTATHVLNALDIATTALR